MALSFTAAKANVLRHFYTVYMRETTTAMAAADYDTLEHWNTFIGLFNAIGKCENEQVSVKETPNVRVVDFGEERIYSYAGEINIKYIQGLVADMSDLDDLRGHDADMLLVDPINLFFIYVHNQRFLVEKHLVSGEIPEFDIKCEIENAETSGTYGVLHTYGTIPTV